MLGIDRKILEEISPANGIGATNIALPFLQEFYNENIDANLQEIADELLNDLHFSLEDNDSEGDISNAEIQGDQCELSRSLVGLSQSSMESAQDRSCSVMSSVCSNEDDDDEIHDLMGKNEPLKTCSINSETKMFYADEVPMPEMCFEIENEEVISSFDDTMMCFNNLEKSTRLDQLISPIPLHHEYDDLKSPLNPYSDCGYSSQGSPSSIHDLTVTDITNDDFNFLELFPSLAC